MLDLSYISHTSIIVSSWDWCQATYGPLEKITSRCMVWYSWRLTHSMLRNAEWFLEKLSITKWIHVLGESHKVLGLSHQVLGLSHRVLHVTLQVLWWHTKYHRVTWLAYTIATKWYWVMSRLLRATNRNLRMMRRTPKWVRAWPRIGNSGKLQVT